MIGEALVVAGLGSEAVGALEGGGSEGEDAGEGKRCCEALLSLACLFSEAFFREDTLLHVGYLAVSNRTAIEASQGVRVCAIGLAPSQWVLWVSISWTKLSTKPFTESNAENFGMARSIMQTPALWMLLLIQCKSVHYSPPSGTFVP